MRYRYPSQSDIEAVATPLSRKAFAGAETYKRLLPRESDCATHVGEGVFLTRCKLCGAVFLNPGASTRPASLADHLFQEHDIYDGYMKPIYPLRELT